MSNLERDPQETECGGVAAVAEAPASELIAGREVVLGGPRAMKVTRTLPTIGRRMVGAWCFVDHYGPESTTMRVAPHPHTGLQTVSWLVEGEVHHRDSIGSDQVITPGRLNLMTAGRGIAHSEESRRDSTSPLHGVQLWVALPDASRHTAPHFEHHPDLPVLTGPGTTVTVLMGDLGGDSSPARIYSPLVGAEVVLLAGGELRLPARPGFEYAVQALSGTALIDGIALVPGSLLYLGTGRSEIALTGGPSARVLLLGGEPFDERIVMWWNFVGRDHDEIMAFREEWEKGRAPGSDGSGTFGAVRGFDAPALPAPTLPATPLKPRGRVR